MSTPNFETQYGYPLMIVDDTDYCFPRCPKCGSWMEKVGDEWDCCECEYHTDEPEGFELDDFSYEFEIERVQDELEDFNDTLMFHKLTLKSGYYRGVQTYVESNDPHYMENYETRYEWDLYRSQAIRKYDSEERKVNRYLHKLKYQGLKELELRCTFSNGEAIYDYV